mmetsp:Transcript_32786/g.71492  ORF Transcript_32786/g.71492 Transcript_32786/m.71492 type:complete len:164 (+) Transcript_32786:175-666(+)
MKEISDPKGREEQFTYLEQLEKQGDVPPGMKLLKPTAGFCCKTTIYKFGSNRTTRIPQKCFINVCSHPEIDLASETEKGYWQVPHLVSAARPDQDKEGGICTTFEAIFSPETIAKCEQNPNFQEMCVNIALESMGKHHKNSGDSISKDWKLLKNLKCKGQRPG